jgi:hypothetical protein
MKEVLDRQEARWEDINTSSLKEYDGFVRSVFVWLSAVTNVEPS